MTDKAANKDWALFKITGREAEKGYLYVVDIETGKKVTLTKRAGAPGEWAKKLCDENSPYFAPDGAVIAAYGVRYINDTFVTAEYGSSVAKNEAKQEVIIAPMKISRNPKKLRNPTPNKESFLDVLIQDRSAQLVPRIDDLKEMAIKAIEGGGDKSHGIDGIRGFMLRTVDADGSVHSWEFLGMQNSSPRKIWEFHFSRSPAAGRSRNLLESAIGIAKNKLSTPGAIVEVVGLTQMPINDFNSQQTVDKLASSTNYCTTLQDGRVVGAYSIAAIVFEKNRKNMVYSQTPLPRHAAGSTTHGRFAIPYSSVNQKLESFSEAAVAKNIEEGKKTEVNRSTKVATGYPLRVEDHVNNMGQVSAFNIVANDGEIAPMALRILNAIDDITPIKIATRAAYSYPIRFRGAVLASLSDLLGTPPLYLENVSGDRIAIKGRVGDKKFRDQIDQVFGSAGQWDAYHEGYVMPNTEHTKAVAWLKQIGPSNEPYHGNKKAQAALQAAQLGEVAAEAAAPAPVAARPAAGQTKQTTNAAPYPASKPKQQQPRKLSFGEWQERQFRKDPYLIANALSEEISRVAEEAGIDWGESQQELVFSSPGVQGALVKSNRIRVLKPDYKGSVGFSAHLYEKHGTIALGRNGQGKADSYITFKINFFNPKITGDKSKVITYNAYEDLHRMYQRDMTFGQDIAPAPEIDTAKLDAERAAKAEMARAKAEAEAKAMQKSLDFWNRETFLLPKEEGTHDYVVAKNMAGGLGGIDIRTGVDRDGNKFIVKRLHDINDNFMGAQQIFDRYSIEKGVEVQLDCLTNESGGIPGGEYSLSKDFMLLNGGKPVFYSAGPDKPRSPVRQMPSGVLRAEDGNDVMHNGKPVYFNNLRQFVTERFSRNNKKFVFGTRFTDTESGAALGPHCKYGEPTASSRIYFVEGLATGDAIYQATSAENGVSCVVVCLDSGNLPAVVSHYRQKYPTHQFVVCADNDIYKPRTGNAGMRAAMNAAINSKCLIAKPDFSAMDQSGSPTDWKDMHLMAGLAAVSHQLKGAKAPPANPVDFYRELLAYSGSENLAKDMQQAVSDIVLAGSAGTDRAVITSRLEQGLAGAYAPDVIQAAARVALEPGQAFAGAKQPVPVFPVSGQGNSGAQAGNPPAMESAEEGVGMMRVVDFPVTIERRTGKEGKPYLLVKDSSGLHTDRIETALKRDGSGLLFNSALNGWVTRAYRERILNAELYDLTGAAQMYLSVGMRDKSKIVVRGDFSDPALVQSTLDLLKGFNCRYVPTEHGIIFDEQTNSAVLENRLGSLLQPQEKQLVYVETADEKAAKEHIKATRAAADSLAEVIGSDYGSSQLRSIIWDMQAAGDQLTEEEKSVIGVIDAKIFARGHAEGEGMLTLPQRASILAEQVGMILGSEDISSRISSDAVAVLESAGAKLKAIAVEEDVGPYIDPNTLDDEAVRATASWFDIPEPVVISALTTSRSEMMMGEKSAQMFDEQFPVATLPLKDFQVGVTATTYTKDAVQYARSFDPADISAQNQFQMDKLDFDPVAAKYLEWGRAGFRAPPIRVWKNNEGRLVTSNIRRLWAAQKLGQPITALYVVDNKHTGRKLALDALVGYYAQQVAEAINRLDVVAEYAEAMVVDAKAAEATVPEIAAVSTIEAETEAAAAQAGAPEEQATAAQVATTEVEAESPPLIVVPDHVVVAAVVEGVEAGIAAEMPAAVDVPVTAEDVIEADIRALYTITNEVDRVKSVIADINLMVENMYNYQEIRGAYLNTPACPYFDPSTGEFNDIHFASDCKNILKTSPDSINGINNIASPEDVYDIAYAGLAAERIRELDAFMCAFYAEKGQRTLRSFYSYVNGTRELACGMKSPYVIDGEFMNEQMTNDIKTLTDHPTIVSMYDAVMENLAAGMGTQLPEQVEVTLDAEANQDHDIDISVNDFESEVVANSVSHHGGNSVMLAVYRMTTNEDTLYRLDAVSFSRHEPLFVRSAYYGDANLAVGIMKSAAKAAAASGAVLLADIESPDRYPVVEMRSEVSMNRLLRNETVQVGDRMIGRVSEYRKTSGDPIVSDKGMWADPRASLVAFNILYDMDAAEYEKSRVMRDAIERNQKKRTQTIGEFLKESASKGVSTQDLFRSLADDFGVKLDDSQQLTLRTQYMKLCAQVMDSRPEVKESMVSCADECRFDVLREETRKFIAQRLSYDVYVNDMFKSDGLKTEYNPYFNHEKNKLDGDALRSDMKKMKVHSLARFYESEFVAMHGVNSFDVKIDSPYQSIPNNTDLDLPLRVRFSDIENLLTSAPEYFTAKESLPSFEEWLRYPVSVTPIHPILAEDVALANPDELFEKYGVEPLLLLASVSCVDASSVQEDGVALARMIIESTKAMEMISSYSDDELKFVEPMVLSDFARIFQIPEMNDPEAQTDVLIDYLAARRDISRLRISEYSYLATAISMEKAGIEIPPVVADSIDKIVNGSKEFLAEVADVVFRSSTNLIRKDINYVESVMFNDNARDVISDLVVLDYMIDKVVAYGGKQEQGLDMVKYDYKYMFKGSHSNVTDLPMPAGISSFAIFKDNAAIATPTPLPVSYLVKFGMKPISKPAIEKAMAPYAEWIAAHGELTMVNPVTEVVTSVTMNDKGVYQMQVIHDDGRLEAVGASKSLPKLLMNSSHYGVFADLDGGICLGTSLNREPDEGNPEESSIIDFDAAASPTGIGPAATASMAVMDALWHVPGIAVDRWETVVNGEAVTETTTVEHFGETMRIVAHADGMIEFGPAAEMAAGKQGVMVGPDVVRQSLYQAMNLNEDGRLPELKLMTHGQAAYAWQVQGEDSEIHSIDAAMGQSFETMDIVNGLIEGGMIRNRWEYAYFSHLRDSATPDADPRVLANLDRMLEIIEEREQMADINSPADSLDGDALDESPEQAYFRQMHGVFTELYSVKYWAACCADEGNEAIREKVKLAFWFYPEIEEEQILDMAARLPDGVDVVFDTMCPKMMWTFIDNRREFPLSVRHVNPVDCCIMLLEAMQKQAIETPRGPLIAADESHGSDFPSPATEPTHGVDQQDPGMVAGETHDGGMPAHQELPAPLDEEGRIRRQLEFGTGIIWWVDDNGEIHNGVVNGRCFEGDTKMPVIDVVERKALDVDVIRIRDADGIKEAYAARAIEFAGPIDDFIERLATFRQASVEILTQDNMQVPQGGHADEIQDVERRRAAIITQLVDDTCALSEAVVVKKNIKEFSLRSGINDVELYGLQFRVEREDGAKVTADSLDEMEKMMRLERRQAGMNNVAVSVAAVSSAAVLEDVNRKPGTQPQPQPQPTSEPAGTGVQMGLGF